MNLSIQILSNPQWSYAYAGTRRPVLREITLDLGSTLPQEDIEVFPRVSFEFPLPEEVAKPWVGFRRIIEARGENIGKSITWEPGVLLLNLALLGRLLERVHGYIKVEIVEVVSGTVLCEAKKPLAIMAANEWYFEGDGENSFDEVLGAFVLPSDPFVIEILADARRILAQETGDSSTEGYQGDREWKGDDHPLEERSRAFKIAGAIYDAIRAKKLSYSNPSGGLEPGVQRVRTPSQVREENCATCLDSSVLMAACFAQAGLQPVLIFPEGHAFAGFLTGEVWRDTNGDPLRDVDGKPLCGKKAVDGILGKCKVKLRSEPDRSDICSFIDGRHLQLVETTTTTTGDSASFRDACLLHNTQTLYLKGKPWSVVLVSLAWQAGFTPPVSLAAVPLHGFAPAETGATTAPEVDGAGVPDADLYDEIIADDPRMLPEERAVPPRVRQWMASLLDLSSRNPLLRFKPAQVLEFDLPRGFLGQIDDMLYTPKKRISLISPRGLPFEWVHAGATPGDFEKWLKEQLKLVYPNYALINEIQRKVESALESVRADPDHPGHSVGDADLVRFYREALLQDLESKLLAAIRKVDTKAKETMLSTGTNSLYLALGTMRWKESSALGAGKKQTDWCAPLYLYPVILEGGKGIPFTLRLDPNGEATPNYCLHEKLRRAPYNINLQELIHPTLEEMGLDIGKNIALIEKNLRDAKLDHIEVAHSASLGVFLFSTFRLWKDFKDNWKLMSQTSAVAKHLMYTANSPFTGDAALPEPRLEPHLPIAADDSQKEAVQWALDGRSFRLEGPPGTGKSQTITNLLASCIASNRKVLFVAEKQTALNAVKDRLEAAGLGRYCLNLHAKGDSDTRLRKNIKDALNAALAAHIDPEEKRWLDLSQKLTGEEKLLDRFRTALHENAANGHSAWSAHEEIIDLGEGPTIDLPSGFSEDFAKRWPRLREICGDIQAAMEIVGDLKAHPWRLIEGSKVELTKLDQVTLALQWAQSAFSDVKTLGGVWPDLLRPKELAYIKLFSKAVVLKSLGRLPRIEVLANLSPKGEPNGKPKGAKNENSDFGKFVDEARVLGAAIVPYLGPVPPTVLQSSDLAELARLLDDLDDLDPTEPTGSTVGVSSLLTETASIATRVMHLELLLPRTALQFDIGGQTKALPARFGSPEEKLQFEDFIVTARAIELEVRQHFVNVAPGFFERPDRMNVEILLGDAESAWWFSRRRKTKALRRLLGSHAITSDDRLLMLSVRQLVRIAKSAQAVCEVLKVKFAREYSEKFKPWVSGDIDDVVESFNALRALKLGIRNEKVAAIRRLLVNEELDIEDDRVLTSLKAWLIAAPAIGELRDRLYQVLWPGYQAEFRPWISTDVDEIEETCQSLVDISSALVQEWSIGYLYSVLDPVVNEQDAKIVLNVADAWDNLNQVVELSPVSLGRWFSDRSLTSAVLSEFPGLLKDGAARHFYLGMTRWCSLCSALACLGEVGLGHASADLMSQSFDVTEFLNRVRRASLLEAQRDRMVAGNLDRFDRKSHERHISQFETARSDVRALLVKRIPGLVSQRTQARALPTGHGVGAVQGLLRGLKPVRGEKTPIRDLIRKYGEALSDAMPCFLMSPDSVATLLPVESIKFSLVVFDEASQVRTSHSVGALGRGTAGIVVGDSLQMPPSNLFSSNAGTFVQDDDWGAEVEDVSGYDDPLVIVARPVAAKDSPSILEEFIDANLPYLQLNCHYRSKDEVLIAFSNTHIYETPMLTFPSISGLESKALRFVHVADGVFQRDASAPAYEISIGKETVSIAALRTNYREAEEVVTEILGRLRDPQRIARRAADSETNAESIIVVTFNIQQMKLVSELLRAADETLFEASTAEGEPDEESGKRTPPQLKIRNVENVQGDEAETVIFSVAFSKTPTGKFPLNFGPITQPGGERRLNVAVTRAQREMIVFASFLPEQMGEKNKTMSEGAKMLQRFISLAEQGPNRSGNVGIQVRRSSHIEAVSQELRDRGYRVQSQLGLSALRVDLAVRRKDSASWELAIMVDDVCWADRGSAFQREILPRQVLPALGWKKVMRIWLPAWINDKEGILQDIDTFFAEIENPPVNTDPVAELPGSSIVPEPVQGPAPTIITSAEMTSGRFIEFTPFTAREVTGSGVLTGANRDARKREQVMSIVNDILQTEAPVEAQRLAKLACNCMGFGRVTSDRVSQVLELIPKNQFMQDSQGKFVWNVGQDPTAWKIYRTSLGSATREPEEISSLEYGNALVDLVTQGLTVLEDAAVREIAAVFGFKQLTTRVRKVLKGSFAKAVSDGRLVLSAGEYRVS